MTVCRGYQDGTRAPIAGGTRCRIGLLDHDGDGVREVSGVLHKMDEVT